MKGTQCLNLRLFNLSRTDKLIKIHSVTKIDANIAKFLLFITLIRKKDAKKSVSHH